MSKWDMRLRVVEPAKEAGRPLLREVPGPSRIALAHSLRELTPYSPVSSQHAIKALGGQTPIFKLDWNEATIPPSPKVKEAISQYIAEGGELNWYPELGAKSLCLALSDYTGLRPDSILVTNGSDDALDLICSSFIDKGDEVVVPVPTYNHFVVFAQSRGANIKSVLFEDPFAADIDTVMDAMSENTRMLYLVSPNNPTGVVTSPEDVVRVCEAFPNTLVIVDEAYFEFSQVSSIQLVQRFTNLIVTRTFSKAFGLAGLRVGYLSAHPDIIDGLGRIYNPKSVNTFAQIGTIAALDDIDYLNSYLDQVLTAKELLRTFFATRPNIQTWVTDANFVVVRVPNIQESLRRLESLGVYVRDRSSYPGLEGCLRMSVGTVEQTQKLIDRLAKVF